MFELKPVAEADQNIRSQFDWVPSASTHSIVELSGNTPDADVAQIVALLASYNGLFDSGSLEQICQAIIDADTLVLAGGLLVRSDEMEILPSCCCGLEDWREWYFVEPGGPSPLAWP